MAEGRVEAAADSSDWVGGFDCSSEGTVSFHVSENAGDESRVAVVSLTYVYPEGESLPVTVEVMQEGTAENVPDDKDIFGIDVSDVTVSSVSIHAVCNEPGLAWTTQVISKNEFESMLKNGFEGPLGGSRTFLFVNSSKTRLKMESIINVEEDTGVKIKDEAAWKEFQDDYKKMAPTGDMTITFSAGAPYTITTTQIYHKQ